MLLRSWELASWSGLLEWSSSWPLSWSVSSGSSTSLHSEEQQKMAHTVARTRLPPAPVAPSAIMLVSQLPEVSAANRAHGLRRDSSTLSLEFTVQETPTTGRCKHWPHAFFLQCWGLMENLSLYDRDNYLSPNSG